LIFDQTSENSIFDYFNLFFRVFLPLLFNLILALSKKIRLDLFYKDSCNCFKIGFKKCNTQILTSPPSQLVFSLQVQLPAANSCSVVNLTMQDSAHLMFAEMTQTLAYHKIPAPFNSHMNNTSQLRL
jgi:hypothetical protein